MLKKMRREKEESNVGTVGFPSTGGKKKGKTKVVIKI